MADIGSALAKLDGVVALHELGVIAAVGADAANFLHGQLTQDIAGLGNDQMRLAALCNAKGRMLASFQVLRPDPEIVLLLCSRDLLAATLKRLTMFVLRAKVKLSDATETHAIYGLAGGALAANGIDTTAQPGQCLGIDIGMADGVSVGVLQPVGGVARALWIAPASQAAPAGSPLDAALWRWSEVQSGIVTLSAPVVEAFVPQMLNYESVGGVNFKKGCYPGQEVVARSQFRGTQKRRTYLLHSDRTLAVGDDVLGGTRSDAANEAHEPVGTVAQAAPAPGGGWAALASLQIAAVDAGPLHAASPAGAVMAIDPLPYALLQDV
ncbi:MAG: folate-binding protein [Variovorax sp.]